MPDPDWDHVRYRYVTADAVEFLHTLERRPSEISERGDIVALVAR